MSAELNVYTIDPTSEISLNEKYDSYSFHNYGDFAFQKSTSKNMNKLWSYFHSKENYPEYYLGIAKKVAICKCPITEKEEWFNGERCLSIENPEKGSIITVTVRIKTRVYTRDFIFMGWAKNPVHEWRMKKGTTFQLEQKFVDGLFPEDKRYLKITT
jgi:hypothetical protein